MNKNSDKNEITAETVRYVAGLARISLNEKEEKVFGDQLAQIIGYVKQLAEVDVEGVQPTTHVLSSMKNVFREDVPADSIGEEEALLNAPDKTKDFFKVPKIIKER